MEGFSRNAPLQLVQTDVVFRLVSTNRFVEVDNTKIFNGVSPATRGGYDIHKIFVTNYLGLLDEYRRKNEILWVTIF